MADETLLADATATTDTDTATADTTAATTDTATDTTTTTADATAADTATTTDTADDWRARLAGDDKKLLGYLARVPSEKDLVARVKKHDDDIKAGKYLKPLSDAPTDEELAAYRAQHGIPDAPEGYFDKLADGLVVGDDDKPYVEMFFKEMFGANAPPAQVNAALDAYYGIVEEQAAKEVEAAKAIEQASVEELREEWGPEYKRNINVANSHLATLPAQVQAIFRYGKVPMLDADGEPTGQMVPIGYTAETMRWLAGLALEANPVATVVPGAGANQASAIADEIASIKQVMATDRKRYDGDEKMQARYRELISAQLKLEGKA